MNKVIGLVAIITICFISCTTTNKSTGEITPQEYYKDNPYAQPYISNSHLISKPQAMINIHAFKKHKYRVFDKKTLDNANSIFEHSLLVNLINDPETDSVIFYLAAYPKRDKTVEKDKKRHPFIILRAVPKQSASQSGHGGVNFPEALSQSIYLAPIGICPPPNSGCSVPAN